jgi:hypothetical protein
MKGLRIRIAVAFENNSKWETPAHVWSFRGSPASIHACALSIPGAWPDFRSLANGISGCGVHGAGNPSSDDAGIVQEQPGSQ